MNETAAPKIRVIGAKGRPIPSAEVFAMRLRPNGVLIRVLKSGFSRWVSDRAAWASIHSNSAESPGLNFEIR